MLDVDLRGLAGGGLKLAERFGDEAYYVALCIRSGMVRPELPHRVGEDAARVRALRSARLALCRRRDPPRRPGRVARRARRHHLQTSSTSAPTRSPTPGGTAACRRATGSRSWSATIAASSTPCSRRPSAAPGSCCLNTSFAGPQIREVAGREGTDLLVYDDEYAPDARGDRAAATAAGARGPTARGGPPRTMRSRS